MNPLQGPDHALFVSLSVEWVKFYNQGTTTKDKQEKDRCRQRIKEINRQQQELLDKAKKI